MTYEEKWNTLYEFINYYKEAVEEVDITMLKESEKFKRGELSSLNVILKKMKKLEK